MRVCGSVDAVVCENGGGSSSESPIGEKVLDDLDSYWEDLGARLTVLRMVSDSVVRGMVTAVEGVASETIASMVSELAEVKEKSILNKVDEESQELESDSKTLKSSTIYEDLSQREGGSDIVHDIIVGVHCDFKKKLLEQRKLMDFWKKSWEKKVEEISDVRQELGEISDGFLSQRSFVGSEDQRAGKRKDQLSNFIPGVNLECGSTNDSAIMMNGFDSLAKSYPELDIVESRLLSMEKEDLISHFKSEMFKMNRQHDLLMQVKTEELFSLKRDLLRKKNSNPSSLSENEIEMLQKRTMELVTKLDGILSEDETLPLINENQEKLCLLFERINYLPFDVRTTPIGNADLHLEGINMEVSFRDDILKTILGGVSSEFEDNIQALCMENRIVQLIEKIVVSEAVLESFSQFISLMDNCNKAKAVVEADLSESRVIITSLLQKNKDLAQVITSQSTLLKEKDDAILEASARLKQKENEHHLLCQELQTLRDKVNMQEMLVWEHETESGYLSYKIGEFWEQIRHQEAKLLELGQNNKAISDVLEQSEKQVKIMETIIQEKDEVLSSMAMKEIVQKKHLESILICLSGLHRTMSDFDCHFTHNIAENRWRLNMLTHQCNMLFQHANSWKQQCYSCKQKFDIRCSDLQKAEIEVDLLGNQVDDLMSLLEMIYLSLDHYSLVLQYYPGVIEILKLVKKELKKRYHS